MTEADAMAARELAKSMTRRLYLTYFWGTFRDQTSYSGGARQAYYKHVHLLNDSRVKFGGGAYHLSDFCFIPYGEGWGNRLPPSVLHGCIPVIVQDRVHVELFDVVPYDEFSIRLRVDEVPKMLEILARIQQADKERMRSKMREWEKAFYWAGDGLAYNLTLKVLHKRLHNMWALHY